MNCPAVLGSGRMVSASRYVTDRGHEQVVGETVTTQSRHFNAGKTYIMGTSEGGLRCAGCCDHEQGTL